METPTTSAHWGVQRRACTYSLRRWRDEWLGNRNLEGIIIREYRFSGIKFGKSINGQIYTAEFYYYLLFFWLHSLNLVIFAVICAQTINSYCQTNRMTERKDFQERRFSLKEMTLKAEIEIYKCLPLRSQPAGLSPRGERPSRKISEPVEFVPRGLHTNNHQSLRSYQSQKCLQPNTKADFEEQLNFYRKKFTINTISLKQLKPLQEKRPSLPKIKKRSPQNSSPKQHFRKAELAWVTPEEVMAIKLKMDRKQLPKIAKEGSRSNLQKRMGKKVFNTAKNEISGWNIQQNVPQDLYD